MNHLVLPPFDYVSAPPYIVSWERNDHPHLTWHVGAGTLVLAILQFYANSPGDGPAVRRIVDRRGVHVFGFDYEPEVGTPSVVATEELLRVMGIVYDDDEVREFVERFEMQVRAEYVMLRGGT